MPCILGIDTSAPEGSVALARDARAGTVETISFGGHATGLSVAILRVLHAEGIDLQGVDALAVNEGPGSFTGLRIGMAWVKGAALGSGRPVLLVPAHEAMARAHVGDAGRILTAIPAGRGRVEAALWENARPAWGPEAMDEVDLIPSLLERGSVQDLAIVPATMKLAESLREEANEEGIRIVAMRPLAGAVAEIGGRLLEEGRAADIAAASPAYGREPNARKPGS